MEQAQAQIQEIIKDLVSTGTAMSYGLDDLNSQSSMVTLCVQLVRMDYTEVIIDQRFHRHLIGKNGANSESARTSRLLIGSADSCFSFLSLQSIASRSSTKCRCGSRRTRSAATWSGSKGTPRESSWLAENSSRWSREW